MLDSETEPYLMMENVLEDVSMPDAHTQNLISSSVLPTMCTLDENQKDLNLEEDSLQMLCEAISNRQKIEEQTTLMLCDKETLNNSPKPTLVGQVIFVDNLVTKLLKVLRIIQIDNDNCIQQLINEK